MKFHFEIEIKGKSKPIKIESIEADRLVILENVETKSLSEKQKENLTKARQIILIQRLLPFDWDRLDQGAR